MGQATSASTLRYQAAPVVVMPITVASCSRRLSSIIFAFFSFAEA
jgi:hypothetical protein